MSVWPCKLAVLATRNGLSLSELRRMVQQRLLKVHLDESRANQAANHPLFNWAAVVGDGGGPVNWWPDAGSLVAVHEWTGSFAVDPLHINYVRATEDEHPSLAAVFDKMESESAACRDAHKLLVGLDTRYAFLGVSSLDLTVDDIWVAEASANAAGLVAALPELYASPDLGFPWAKPASKENLAELRPLALTAIGTGECWHGESVSWSKVARFIAKRARGADGWSPDNIKKALILEFADEAIRRPPSLDETLDHGLNHGPKSID